MTARSCGAHAAKLRRASAQLRRGALFEKALLVALDAVAAVVCDESGRIHLASRRARPLLRGGTAFRATLLAAVRGEVHPGVSTTRIVREGAPEYLLVIVSEDLEVPGQLARLARAARDWKLTLTETRVLGWVAQGELNKSIAHRMGVRENTIEVHVSRLLAKAHVSSRAALASKLWSLGDRASTRP